MCVHDGTVVTAAVVIIKRSIYADINVIVYAKFSAPQTGNNCLINTTMDRSNDPPGGHLSDRVARALQPGLSYFKAFADAQRRPWSAEDPEGVINIVVAENKLGAPLVHVSRHAFMH